MRSAILARAVLLGAVVLPAGAPAVATEEVSTVPLASGWEYLWIYEEWDGRAPPPIPESDAAGWRPVESVTPREIARADQAWLRCQLPTVDLEAPGIAFWSSRAAFIIYLDGEPIYEFGLDGDLADREGWTSHFVPLPERSAGRTLHLWGPDPVPGSISVTDWELVPGKQVSLLRSRRLKRMVAGDLGPLFFGSFLIVLGLVAAGVYFFRGERRDLAPLYFGAFAFIYGLRLLAQSDAVSLATDLSPLFWSRVVTYATYAINIPSVLFFEQFYGRGWKSSIRRLWQLQTVYAVAAVAADLVTGGIGVLMFANAYLVLLGMAVFLCHVFGPRLVGIPEAPVFKASFLILAVFVVNENLVGAGLVPWSLSPEEIGFTIFICGLGYALVRRIAANERKLAAVEVELDTARQIQTSILPTRMPRVGELEVAARYEPVASVAGDFYDFLPVGEHGLAVLIADVAGHGVPAALIASMVKASFSAQAAVADDPGRVLTAMNRILRGSLEKRFVTAGCLYVDTSTHAGLYASGGHLPPLIWRRAERRVDELSGRGPILGRFAEAEYQVTPFRSRPGDRIYLFTDGILEAASADGEQFGEARFRGFIESHHELAPARFIDDLLSHLERWTAGQVDPDREDDLTILALDFPGG